MVYAQAENEANEFFKMLFNPADRVEDENELSGNFMTTMPVFNLRLMRFEYFVKNEKDITTKECLKNMHLGNLIDCIVNKSKHEDASSLKFNTLCPEESQM